MFLFKTIKLDIVLYLKVGNSPGLGLNRKERIIFKAIWVMLHRPQMSPLCSKLWAVFVSGLKMQNGDWYKPHKAHTNLFCVAEGL